MLRFSGLVISVLMLFGVATAQEKEPQTIREYSSRGIKRFDKGDFDGAIADFTKVISLDPKNASAYFSRGINKLEKGNDNEAEQDLAKAIELNPNLKVNIEEQAAKIRKRRSVTPRR